MNRKSIIRFVVVVTALFLITYALAVSLSQYNTLGMFLSLGSLGALCVCLYLFSLLRQAPEEEERETY